MADLITKEEALAFRERWRRINEREVEEMRSASLELKWQQFNTLLTWTRQFGWEEELREGEAEVRERWMRLRKAHSEELARRETQKSLPPSNP